MRFISQKAPHEIGKLPSGLSPARGLASIGIDLVEVAESHVLLFGRVKEFVHGELPNAKNLAELEQSCELAHWLNGFGATRFGQLRSFTRVHDAHAEFHVQAAAVIEKIHTGSWTAAEQMRKSELARALRRMLVTLAELNDSIAKEAWRIN